MNKGNCITHCRQLMRKFALYLALLLALSCATLKIEFEKVEHHVVTENTIALMNSLSSEDQITYLMELRRKRVIISRDILAEFIVAVKSQHLALAFVKTLGILFFKPFNLDRCRILNRLHADRDNYIPILKTFIENGLQFSDVELYVFTEFGLQVDPVEGVKISCDQLENLLLAINQIKVRLGGGFLKFLLSKLSELRPDSKESHLSSIFAAAFCIMDEPNIGYLQMIKEAGITVDGNFIAGVVKYGTEFDLKSSLGYLERHTEITKIFLMLDALCETKISDECPELQTLFIRLLTDYELNLNDSGCATLFKIILPRPKFVKILHDVKPEYLFHLREQLQSPVALRTKEAFLRESMKGFEGPDKFLECAHLELGSYIYHYAYRPDRELTNAAVRYAVHRKLASTLQIYGNSILKEAIRSSLLSQETEPYECIQELLHNGADVNDTSDAQMSPIRFVLECWHCPSTMDTLILLIRAGADVSDIEQEYQELVRLALSLCPRLEG